MHFKRRQRRLVQPCERLEPRLALSGNDGNQPSLLPELRVSNFGQDIPYVVEDYAIVSIPVTTYGSGYSTAPQIIVAAPSNPEGVQATAEAVLANGGITTVTIVDGGRYAANDPVTVTVLDASHTGGSDAVATITAHLAPKIGEPNVYSVQYVTIVDPGEGYVTPQIGFGGSSLGRNATATAAVTQGLVRSVTVTNPGRGYASDESYQVIISGGTAQPGMQITPPVFGHQNSVSPAKEDVPDRSVFQQWAQQYIQFVANNRVSVVYINIGDYSVDTKGVYNFLDPQLGTNGVPWVVTDFLDPISKLQDPETGGPADIEVGAIAYLKDAWKLYDTNNVDGNLQVAYPAPGYESPPRSNIYQAFQLVNEINSYSTSKFITHFEFDGEGGGAFSADDSAYGFGTGLNEDDQALPGIDWTKSQYPTTGVGYTKWLWNHFMPGADASGNEWAPGGKAPGSQAPSADASTLNIPDVVWTDKEAMDAATWRLPGARPYQWGYISYFTPGWYSNSAGPVQSFAENYWFGENNFRPGAGSAVKPSGTSPTGGPTLIVTETTTYSSPPAITFSTPPNGHSAAGFAVMKSGSPSAIDHIVLTRLGDGYSAAHPPTYRIGNSPTEYHATIEPIYNKSYAPIFSKDTGSFLLDSKGNSLITVAAQGSGYSAGVEISSGGSYTKVPGVSFSSPPSGGQAAQGIAVLDAHGGVASILITDPGEYGPTDTEPTITFHRAAGDTGTTDAGAVAYLKNFPRVSITSSKGTGAVAYATVAPTSTSGTPNPENGYSISGIQFAPGTGGGDRQVGGGYYSAGDAWTDLPTITISPPASGVRAFADGGMAITTKYNAFWLDGSSSIKALLEQPIMEAVGAVTVIAQGSGYGPDTTVVFSDPDPATPGQGTARGYVVLDSGSITRIAVVDPGEGYTTPPTITIQGSSGSGASLEVQPLVPKVRGGGNAFNYQLFDGDSTDPGNENLFSVNAVETVYSFYQDHPESLAQMFNDPLYTAEPLKELGDVSYQSLNMQQDNATLDVNYPAAQGTIATFSIEGILNSNPSQSALGGAVASLDAYFQQVVGADLDDVNAFGGTFSGLSSLSYTDFITFLNTAADIIVGSQKATGVSLSAGTDFEATTTAGTTVIDLTSHPTPAFKNITIGVAVEGPGVTPGTTVHTVAFTEQSNTLTLSQPLTAPAATLLFYTPIEASDVTFQIYDAMFIPTADLTGKTTTGPLGNWLAAGAKVQNAWVIPPAATITRPQLRRATTIRMSGDQMGPSPFALTHTNLMGAAVVTPDQELRFVVTGVAAGTLEKWDGTQWRNLLTPITSGSPFEMARHLVFRTIGRTDLVRWTPPADAGRTVNGFRVLGWDGQQTADELSDIVFTLD